MRHVRSVGEKSERVLPNQAPDGADEADGDEADENDPSGKASAVRRVADDGLESRCWNARKCAPFENVQIENVLVEVFPGPLRELRHLLISGVARAMASREAGDQAIRESGRVIEA